MQTNQNKLKATTLQNMVENGEFQNLKAENWVIEKWKTGT